MASLRSPMIISFAASGPDYMYAGFLQDAPDGMTEDYTGLHRHSGKGCVHCLRTCKNELCFCGCVLFKSKSSAEVSEKLPHS